MKSTICVFVFSLICIATSAQSKKEKEIIEAENIRYAAMISLDTAVLQKVIAEDVEYIHSNGLLDTKKSFIESVYTKNLVHRKIDIKSQKVRFPDKKVAIVTGTCTYDIIYKAQEMKLDFFYTNMYVKRKGEWILINRQTSKMN
jgi:hypothetical protein